MEEYIEVTCPCCKGDFANWEKHKYFKTRSTVGYVACKWCMDTGVVKQVKKWC